MVVGFFVFGVVCFGVVVEGLGVLEGSFGLVVLG